MIIVILINLLILLYGFLTMFFFTGTTAVLLMPLWISENLSSFNNFHGQINIAWVHDFQIVLGSNNYHQVFSSSCLMQCLAGKV